MIFIRQKIILCLITIAFGATSETLAQTSPRTKYNFNSDWKVLVGDPLNAETAAFDDSHWKIVTTPYAWNEDDAFRKDLKDLSTGVAWYRKHFKLPAGSAGRKVF